jgi:hypothetical protein
MGYLPSELLTFLSDVLECTRFMEAIHYWGYLECSLKKGYIMMPYASAERGVLNHCIS